MPSYNLPGSFCVRSRYGFAKRGAPSCRCVVRVTRSELRHCALNRRRGRADVGIANAEDNDILTTLTRRRRFIVSEPGVGALTADALYKIRKLHRRHFACVGVLLQLAIFTALFERRQQ